MDDEIDSQGAHKMNYTQENKKKKVLERYN